MKRGDLIVGEFYAVKPRSYSPLVRWKLLDPSGEADVPAFDWRGVETGKLRRARGVVFEREDGTKAVVENGRAVVSTWAAHEAQDRIDKVNSRRRNRTMRARSDAEQASVEPIEALAALGVVEAYAPDYGGIRWTIPDGSLRKLADHVRAVRSAPAREIEALLVQLDEIALTLDREIAQTDTDADAEIEKIRSEAS